MKTLFASFIAAVALFAGVSSAQAAPSDGYGPRDSMIVTDATTGLATLTNFESVRKQFDGTTVDRITLANDDWCVQAVMMPDIRRSEKAWPSATYLTVLTQVYGITLDLNYNTPVARERVRQYVENERRRCSQFLSRSRDREAGMPILTSTNGAGMDLFRSVAALRHEVTPEDFDRITLADQNYCTRVQATNLSSSRMVMLNTADSGPYAVPFSRLIRPNFGHYYEDDFVRYELVRGVERFCSSFLNNASRF
jgi:hypothetical protein